METKINIAEILKDKLVNTKLYSPVFGDVYLLNIDTKDIIVKHHGSVATFYHNGKLYGYDEAEPLLFPSKEMRDWRKFFKKGDVLVSKDRNVHIIFEKFEDDAYKNFHGQYYLWEEGGSMVSFEEDENYMQTSDFNKANKEDAQEYIHKIEKILGGKLNHETLEVEKAQPEFKDGDIVVYGKSVAICRKICKHTLFPYVSIDETSRLLFNDNPNVSLDECRFATEEEKQQLFSALEKEGKAWDSKKKQVVDLKPKWTPKPFDRVITRNAADDVWTANIFSHIDSHGEYVTIACVGGYTHCLPYNEETAKLIGTTKNVED